MDTDGIGDIQHTYLSKFTFSPRAIIRIEQLNENRKGKISQLRCKFRNPGKFYWNIALLLSWNKCRTAIDIGCPILKIQTNRTDWEECSESFEADYSSYFPKDKRKT